MNILNTFLLEQYAYQKGSRIIRVQPGDIVIDAGGCWGDTALYFADKAASRGAVYCFEFVPENLEIFNLNLSLNQNLSKRIEIVPKALWDSSKQIVEFSIDGPATSLVKIDKKQSPDLRVSTVTLDDFVAEERISRVDYIKMDIESAELQALRGAEKTLRTFRPRLAIALYHKEDDIVTIPEYLGNLNLDYEFFLDHFSLSLEETVLFAKPV